MEITTNYGLKKPGQDEFYNVDDFNGNMDVLDEELKKCNEALNAPMEIETEFTPASVRENIKSGEKFKITLGKIAKFFADLKTVAFTGSYNDLSNKPSIPEIPGSIKNPYLFKANGKSYDGSKAVDMGTLGIGYGGTGGTTAEAARSNLGLGTASTFGVGGLTTTEDGFLLRAKDGKSLQDQVSQINSNLTNETLARENADNALIKKQIMTIDYYDPGVIKFRHNYVEKIGSWGYLVNCVVEIPLNLADGQSLFSFGGVEGFLSLLNPWTHKSYIVHVVNGTAVTWGNVDAGEPVTTAYVMTGFLM